MQTTTYVEVDEETKVEGEILAVGTRREMFLVLGHGAERLTLHVSDPAFLDKLSNEADRLCREFVGDVP